MNDEQEKIIRRTAPSFQAPEHDFSDPTKRELNFDDSHLWTQGKYVDQIEILPLNLHSPSPLEKRLRTIKRFLRPTIWSIIAIYLISESYSSGTVGDLILYIIVSTFIHFKFPRLSPWKVEPEVQYVYYNISNRSENIYLAEWAEETFRDFHHKAERANLFGAALAQIQLTLGNEAFIILEAREGYSTQYIYSAINQYATVLDCQTLKPVAYNQARVKLRAIPK